MFPGGRRSEGAEADVDVKKPCLESLHLKSLFFQPVPLTCAGKNTFLRTKSGRILLCMRKEDSLFRLCNTKATMPSHEKNPAPGSLFDSRRRGIRPMQDSQALMYETTCGRWAGRHTGPESRRYAGRARWPPWGNNPCARGRSCRTWPCRCTRDRAE